MRHKNNIFVLHKLLQNYPSPLCLSAINKHGRYSGIQIFLTSLVGGGGGEEVTIMMIV